MTEKFDFITLLNLIRGLEAPHYYLSYILDNATEYMNLTGVERTSARFKKFYHGMKSVPIPANRRGADYIRLFDECYISTPTLDPLVQTRVLREFTTDMLSGFPDEETYSIEDTTIKFFFTDKGVLIQDLTDGLVIGFLTSDRSGLFIRAYDPRVYIHLDYLDMVSNTKEFVRLAKSVLNIPLGKVN